MTFHRPHAAKKDHNHSEIFRDLSKMVGGWQVVTDDFGARYPAYTGFIVGIPFLIVDTSQAGGLSLDTRLYVKETVLDIEIKQPSKRNELTEGEKMYFKLTPQTGRIVTSAEEYYQAIMDSV